MLNFTVIVSTHYCLKQINSLNLSYESSAGPSIVSFIAVIKLVCLDVEHDRVVLFPDSAASVIPLQHYLYHLLLI